MKKLFSFQRLICWSVMALAVPFTLSFCFACFISNVLQAQTSPHPAFRHYTTTEGLPSSEVYCVLEDLEGYLWISTDNGISKFDGYNFKNYGMAEGLKENVIFLLKLDSRGRIWMQAMGGNLYYIEKDVIIEYPYNHVLDECEIRLDVAKGFILEDGGETVYVSTYTCGIIEIDSTGHSRKAFDSGVNAYQVFEKNKALINGINDNISFGAGSQDGLFWKEGQFSMNLGDTQWSIPFHSLTSDHLATNFESFKLAEGSYLIKLSSTLIYLLDGIIQWKIYYPEIITHISVFNDEELWVAHLKPHGLRVFDSIETLKQRHYSYSWLEGETITYLYEDAVGGKWISSNENGLYYINAETFLVHDNTTGLPASGIVALTTDGNSFLYAALSNNEIWQLDIATSAWTLLPPVPPGGDLRDLFFDQEYGQLFAGNRGFHQLVGDQWKTIPYNKRGHSSITANRISKGLHSSSLWICNHGGFFNCPHPAQEVRDVLPGFTRRVFAVLEDYSGNIWVGKSSGLYQFRDQQLISQEGVHPAFGLRIEALAALQDSTIVVATKGGGVIFWKNGRTEQIKTENDLTADMLERLYVDQLGNLWVGTLNGLNKISGSWGNRKVEQITMHNGLPSNEITDILSTGEWMWAATTKGLVQFKDEARVLSSPMPVITSIAVNNTVLDPDQQHSFRHDQNNVSIQFLTLNHRLNGAIRYRYRIDGKAWTNTMNTSVNFPQISPGEWAFQVQSMNEDGVWSAIQSMPFSISPAWYNTVVAKVAGILGLLLLGAGLYQYRIRQIKQENALRLQINDLERSALQAQMNPHFIFNCLSAIQNCILQNEKDLAINYMGNFAKLVRGVLNASISERIMLQEEVELLENYLSLERLRFNNKFDFEIELEPGVDAYDLGIPPLLIQPYVENAVLHGITGKKSGGRIGIVFRKRTDQLEVVISDNGTGYPNKATHSSGAKHKSVGMSITKRRLSLLQAKKDQDIVIIKKKVNADGIKVGTEVSIKIPLPNYEF